MSQAKKRLAVLTGGGEIDITSMSNDELINLVRLDVSRATI